MQRKIILRSLITFFILFFILLSAIDFALENSAEQYAIKIGIEKSAIKIISRLDKDNQFDELEKDFITWLASQNKKEQFKLAFKYAFDGEISSKEISEILSTTVSKNTKNEKISSTKSEIEYLMLDDFENEEFSKNRWRLGKNIHHTIDAKGKAYIDHRIGVEVNGSSLCIEYNIPKFHLLSGGHGGEVGTGFHMDDYKNDIIKYDGITFYIKTTDIRKIFTIGVTEEKNEVHEHFEKNFSAKITGWKEVLIPFSDLLIHEEHAIDNILNLNEVVRIGFFVTDLYEDSDRQGKVWIDRIAFYKELRKDILISSHQTDTQKEVIFNFEDGIRSEYGKWNIGVNENVCGTGSKQKVYIDNNSGANGTNSSLCTEIIGLPSGGKEAEVETHTKLKVKDLDLSQYTGVSFFIKTTCLKKPIALIFIEGHYEKEEWFVRFNPTIEWKEVKIPFSSLEFSPVHNTIDQKLDLSEISEIFIAQYGPLSEIKEKYKIWIDEVSLYKGEIRLSTNIQEKDNNFKQAAVYRGKESQDLSFSIEDLPKSKKLALHEALYYQKLSGNTVQCEICPNRCTLAEGETGDCNNRQNIKGKLYTLVYGQPCALTVDPIEKGPIFHMKPGMRTLALGTAGCNLKCKNCQNWQFTQVGPEETVNYKLSPKEAINLAHKYKCEAIVFTYNDPIVSYEYVLDIAKLAKKNNLKMIMITAGYINPEPLRELCQYMDAIKVDLKGFTNEFYQKVCRGTLQPVLDTIKIIKEEGVWLEIVNLVIPSFNDKSSEIRAMCEWIKDNIGPDTPIYFSRFWHSYKLENMETTPVRTLENAFSIAVACGLNYVYIGNVPGHPKGNTYCPHCGKLLIERIGFLAIGQNNIVNGKCKFCHERIPGVW